MIPNFTILGVGNPILDAIAHVDDVFVSQIAGSKGGMELVDSTTINELISKIANDPIKVPGGSAGNVIFALARMGISSKFLGKTGNCPDGQFYRENFAQLGGDKSRFKIGQIPNGRCLSLVTPDSERTMRTDLGAAMTLDPAEVSPMDFLGCDHAHIEGYLLFNEALMMRILECAQEAGCTISMDLASFEVVEATRSKLPALLEKYVDIVFANEEEASAYTAIRGDFARMAEKLAEICKIAAVKVGAEGSYISNGTTTEKIAPVAAEKLVDTTAAGDLWAAGFLYGWAHKLPLRDCAHIGSILGSAVVQVSGSVLPDSVWNRILDNLRSS